jgi:hypothetical protein
MNTKIILLGAVVTAFAFTSFAAEPLLTPRAAGNQIKVASNQTTPASINVSYVQAGTALLCPRAAGSQLKAVRGIANDTNPALVCLETMNGSPKAVIECSSHATMSGCATIALLK